MKEYIFTHTLDSHIEIRIKAQYYSHAMDLLLSVTRDVDYYRLRPDENELMPKPSQDKHSEEKPNASILYPYSDLNSFEKDN